MKLGREAYNGFKLAVIDILSYLLSYWAKLKFDVIVWGKCFDERKERQTLVPQQRVGTLTMAHISITLRTRL